VFDIAVHAVVPLDLSDKFSHSLCNAHDQLTIYICFVFFSGGVYTPAVAFADTPLVENLKKTGKVIFEVVEPSP